MEGIDSVYWQKCISHMMKEVDYYLELDGITAPSENTINLTKAIEIKVEKVDVSQMKAIAKNEELPSTSSASQTSSLAKDLIMKLKSKWPNLSKGNKNADQKEPELMTFKCNKCSFETNRRNSLVLHIKGNRNISKADWKQTGSQLTTKYVVANHSLQ